MQSKVPAVIAKIEAAHDVCVMVLELLEADGTEASY
jgi:hypothetical protein